MPPVELKQAMAHTKKLSAFMKKQKDQRSGISLAMTTELKSAEQSLSAAHAQLAALQMRIKTAALSSQFKTFIKEGKMTKAEFDGLKINELAAFDKNALAPLVKAYADRKPSTDVVSFGQNGAPAIDPSNVSTAETRRLIKLQKEGKGFASLAEVDPEADPKDKKPDPAAGKDDKGSVQFEDMDDLMKCLDEIKPHFEKLTEGYKKMGDQLKKLAESDEQKAPEKEQESEDEE